MLQTFNRNKYQLKFKQRLSTLRNLFKESGVDGFLVPHNDKFFNEITPTWSNRLEWITGFSGSAGSAIILKKTAVLFTDGRYSIQVKFEVDQSVFQLINVNSSQPSNWLENQIKRKTVIGFDPWLHSITEIDSLTEKHQSLIKFKGIENLIDTAWKDRPKKNLSIAYKRPKRLSGKTVNYKLEQVKKILKLSSNRKLITTCPDTICWLANIRGQDVPNSPLLNCYALVNDNLITIYSENIFYKKATKQIYSNVYIKHFDCFLPDIKHNDTILIEPSRTPIILKQKLVRHKIKFENVANPIHLLKSIKNETEIEGSKKSHVIDGVSFVKFLNWIKAQEIKYLTEIDLVMKLENFRKKEKSFIDISFNTICAAGSNGAITHYRVTEKTNKKIKKNDLILIDSGGQYLEGTTDITRTLINGEPSYKYKLLYTKVLQGLVCLSKLKWPDGLRGRDLDSLARQFLWESGLDYDHGTGHGVGVFSNVHQGPQAISRLNNVVLQPGMIMSNEPGCYLSGKFGIRIENLIVIREEKNVFSPKEKLLSFETLTLVPFEKKLIENSILNKEEIKWINKYHKEVYKKLSPILDKEEKNWLKKECLDLPVN